jgi:peptidylprolyl isomerase
VAFAYPDRQRQAQPLAPHRCTNTENPDEGRAVRRLAAAVIATTLLLAGCAGGDETPEPEETTADGATEATQASADDIAALEAVQVNGDLGSAPELVFETPFAVDDAVARLDVEGDGPALEEGQQVSLHYVAVSGDDGSELGSTWESDSPETLTLGDPSVFPALNDVLSAQNVGARVLFAAPGAEATEGDETTAPTEAFPATLMAIEVVDARTVPTRAEGAAVEPAAGLPVVTLAEDGQPSIEIPADATEPTELVAQTLIEGSGPEVQAGDQLTVQYSGWLWDGTLFDSSWENGAPFQTQIGTASLIQGWDQGLVGKTVGSQVLLVIPSELGYGPEGQNDIPGDATLIFVVDILDAA